MIGQGVKFEKYQLADFINKLDDAPTLDSDEPVIVRIITKGDRVFDLEFIRITADAGGNVIEVLADHLEVVS